MKLLDRLIHNSNGRCDLCNKLLKSREPTLLKIYGKGQGIKQSDANCLVVCRGMAAELNCLSPRDIALKIVNEQEPLICKFKPIASMPVFAKIKKNPNTNKLKISREDYKLIQNPRPPLERQSKNPPPIYLKKKESSYFSERTTKEILENKILRWDFEISLGLMTLQKINRLLEQARMHDFPLDFIVKLYEARKIELQKSK